MPQIIVTKSFKFAHAGVSVESFDESPAPRDTSDEVADWVCKHGFGLRVDSPGLPAPVQAAARPASTKARKAEKAAPENKAGA